MEPNSSVQTLSYLVVIVGFVFGAVINAIVWVYTYGKLQGKIQSREVFLDRKLQEFENELKELSRSLKTAEGDPKYLTRVSHREECNEHTKHFMIETDNIKESLRSLQKAVNSIQDSLLLIATSKQPALRVWNDRD